MTKYLNPLYLYRRWRHKRWRKAYLANVTNITPVFEPHDTLYHGVIVSERAK